MGISKEQREEFLKDIEDVNRDLRDDIDICDAKGILTGAGTLLEMITEVREQTQDEPSRLFTPEQAKRFNRIQNELSGHYKNVENCECKRRN